MENNIIILSPKNDYLFKRLFFDENDKNEILRKLLEDCIEFDDKQLLEIALLDRTIDRELEDDKTIIFDVNAKLFDGTLINIEIQKCNQAGFVNRSVYYAAKRLSHQGTRGYGYKKLKQTVSLNIIDFSLFNDTNGFYKSFDLREKNTNTVLSDILRIDFFEINNTNLINNNDTSKKALWLRFFNAKSMEDLEMIKNTDPTFDKVADKLVYLSSDPSILTIYEEREKARLDEMGRLDYAKEKGILEGEQKSKLEAFINMRDVNLSKETILKVLNIDEETYEQFVKLSTYV